MARSIGVLVSGRIWVGVVEDTTLGAVRVYPGRRAGSPRSEIAARGRDHRADSPVYLRGARWRARSIRSAPDSRESSATA